VIFSFCQTVYKTNAQTQKQTKTSALKSVIIGNDIATNPGEVTKIRRREKK
jgi:hypothetical protein